MNDFTQEAEIGKLKAIRKGLPAWKQKMAADSAVAVYRRKINDKQYMKYCRQCGKILLYRKKKCPVCGSEDLEKHRKTISLSDLKEPHTSSFEDRVLANIMKEQIMNLLTERQKIILSDRLAGVSVITTADKLHCSKDTLWKETRRIQQKTRWYLEH